MKFIVKIAAIALTLAASAASASQGDEITAIGYGKSQQHAKIVAVATWKKAAFDSYGYASWNTARLSPMECFENSYAGGTSITSYDFREIIREGGNDQDPWVCSVTGTQTVKY